VGALGGPNGLHPDGCACAVCETGFAPTAAARALADRAALCAEVARGRAARCLEKQRDRDVLHRHLVDATTDYCRRLAPVKPLTPEERGDLDRLRSMFRKGGRK
jgi:hypothetical protein